ncbi:hypothetical protein CERSUDRAFT_25877, partial [Gelatoporia subvermispora B]
LHLALKIEWAKSKARAKRWTEEVMLINKEMRRAIEYTRWLADYWESRANLRDGISLELQDGIRAYAAEHAAAERRLASQWEEKWAVVRALAKK